MHIVHSVLRENEVCNQRAQIEEAGSKSELELRYHAYEATCHKYQHEIKAIQKYLPGWMPAFNR